MGTAIIMNLVVITVIVAGWTAAVLVFYKSLGDSPAQRRTARSHEVIENPDAATRPATRQDVRSAA